MDKISIQARSRNMARIKAKNTKPELLIRKFLYGLGHRYRVHYPLKGKPDIVFPKYKVAVFINGCFWHGHGCKVDHVSKSNTNFWNKKIETNKKRDKDVLQLLATEGWKAITIWECEIKDNMTKATEEIVLLLSALNKQKHLAKIK